MSTPKAERGRGEDHNGQEMGTFLFPQAAQHFQPIHPWQLHIQQDKLGHIAGITVNICSGAEQEIQRLDSIAYGLDFAFRTTHSECTPRQNYIAQIIFNNQNRCVLHFRAFSSL